ncbi:MAG: gamma-glutamyl-gamma-aminobutyrate hydrolase family protein, partial [Miltoncostaeaceae bacterium]
DGLLLLGGPDIGAARYGAEPHPTADPPVELRDAVELALVAEARRRHLPMLGICRGMQVINIACGGTLVQHLPESHSTEEHRRRTGYFAGNEHGITAREGSRVARAEGEHPVEVASHHHQAVDRLGDGLRVTATAADGMIEALEVEGEAWQVGVQWHPEPDPGSRIIAALVEAARAALAGRAA